MGGDPSLGEPEHAVRWMLEIDRIYRRIEADRRPGPQQEQGA